MLVTTIVVVVVVVVKSRTKKNKVDRVRKDLGSTLDAPLPL